MNRFGLIRNAKAWARLRAHELDDRIATLARNIQRHERDPDYRRSLNDWRRQLMEYRLERSSLGLP
jgi:hypothetical protein